MNKSGQGCCRGVGDSSIVRNRRLRAEQQPGCYDRMFARSEHLYQVEVLSALSRDAGLFEGSNGFRGSVLRRMMSLDCFDAVQEQPCITQDSRI